MSSSANRSAPEKGALSRNERSVLTSPTETGIKAKVENKMQYDEYLKELEPMREELGVVLKESMYPEEAA